MTFLPTAFSFSTTVNVAAVAGDAGESTFLIAMEAADGGEFVMLLEHGRLVHAGEGWESVVREGV